MTPASWAGGGGYVAIMRAETRLRNMKTSGVVRREGQTATLEQGRWFFCGDGAEHNSGNKKGGGPEDPPPQMFSKSGLRSWR